MIGTSQARSALFDFGNTLVEYGPRQFDREHAVVVEAFGRIFGACDAESLRTIRHRQVMAPFANGLRENDLSEICATGLISG